MVNKIISGGQTGVDRAALEVARTLAIPCGGWCPKGRRAEDGPIQARYPLRETPSADYAQRTEWNVRDADGTLILARGTPIGGTALTITVARRLGKPFRIVDLAQAVDAIRVRRWLRQESIGVLNVAGPRESTSPGIYKEALTFLTELLQGI